MKILVDGDACPRLAKDVLFKTTERRNIELLMVANQYIKTPPMVQIKNVVVGAGADVADDKIVELTEAGDLVITSDIPLADRVVKKDGFALSPRGELFDKDNISHRLAMRDLMEDLRNSGMETGGPAAYSAQDRQEFNNTLDRFLTKHS